MKIHHTFRKHYGASLLLMFSLGICGYAWWQIQNLSHTDTPSTKIIPAETQIKPAPTKTKILLPQPQTSVTTTPETATVEPESLLATITVLDQTYPVTLAPSSTVYTAMKTLAESSKISVGFKSFSGLGYFVDSINGTASDTIQARYWIYYINGKKATIGISQYQLKSGDIISWKYEKGE